MENTNKNTIEVAGCCEANIFQADKNGNGLCLDCKEHCIPHVEESARKFEKQIDWEYEQYMAERFGGR